MMSLGAVDGIFSLLRNTLITVLIVTGSLFNSGCSDDEIVAASNSFDVEAIVGQGDFENTRVRAVVVDVAGELLRRSDGRLFEDDSVVTSNGKAQVTLLSSSMYGFVINGFNDSTRICQLFDGCSNDLFNVEFGQPYTILQEPAWRGLADRPVSEQQIIITPLTELVTVFAESLSYIYNSTDPEQGEWQLGGAINTLSLRQADGQLAGIFGIIEPNVSQPANLVDLNRLDSAQLSANNVAYGALIAAFQQAQIAHIATETSPYYHSVVANELLASSADCGQGDQAKPIGQLCLTTRDQILQSAIDNLQALRQGSSLDQPVDMTVELAIGQLQATIDSRSNDPVTDARPAEVETLLSVDEIDVFNNELDEVKDFVAVAADLLTPSLADGNISSSLALYRQDLAKLATADPALAEQFDLVEPLDSAIEALVSVYLRYRECAVDGCSNEAGYDAATKTLSVNESDADRSLELTVSQQTSNLAGEEVASSRFVDVLISGTVTTDEAGTLILSQPSVGSSIQTSAARPVGLRVFHQADVAELSDAESNKAVGYELNLDGFNWQLASTDSLSGNLAVVYRGVDPIEDPSIYAINQISIAAQRVDDAQVQSTLTINGESEFEFDDTITTNTYRDSQFAILTNFFNAQEVPVNSDPVTGVLQLERGESEIRGETVQIYDVVSTVNNFAMRYRFYPTRVIQDRNDFDGDNDTRDTVVVNDTEACVLMISNNGDRSIERCEPKVRFINRESLDAVIDTRFNQLWLSGEISLFEADDGRQILAQWPAENDTSLGLECSVLGSTGFDTAADNGGVDGIVVDIAKAGISDLSVSSKLALSAVADSSPVQISSTLRESVVNQTSVGIRILDAVDNSIALQNVQLNYTGGDIVTESTGPSTTVASSLLLRSDDIRLRLVNDQGLVSLAESAPVLPFNYVLDKEGQSVVCVTDATQRRKDPQVNLDAASFKIQNQDTVYGVLTRQADSLQIQYVNGQQQQL